MLGRILDVFREPSAFKDDPLNWAYSQIGHGYLGCAITTLITWILLYVGGEYPNDWIIAFAVPVAYLVFWEIDVQGWKGWDTIEDTLFVSAGALLFVVIDMSEVIDRLAAWVVIPGFAILIGVYRRL